MCDLTTTVCTILSTSVGSALLVGRVCIEKHSKLWPCASNTSPAAAVLLLRAERGGDATPWYKYNQEPYSLHLLIASHGCYAVSINQDYVLITCQIYVTSVVLKVFVLALTHVWTKGLVYKTQEANDDARSHANISSNTIIKSTTLVLHKLAWHKW